MHSCHKYKPNPGTEKTLWQGTHISQNKNM